MKNEIKTLIKAIGDDYARWTTQSFKANDYDMDRGEAKIDEFRDEIEVKEGSKYIKIMNGNTVWGFINKGNPDFEVGDILKAANWRAPSLNKARGNIFRKYSVAWTGPHYIAGYSAGGERAPVGNTGLLKGSSTITDGSVS